MKYRLLNILTAMLALGGILAGCSVAQEEAVDEQASREIRFRGQLGAFQVKATDTAFEAGDEIGIYAYSIDAYNIKATCTEDGQITPSRPLYWDPYMSASDYMAFSAYYPYNPDYRYDTWALFSVSPDQSTRAGYVASDYMFARTESRPIDGDVVFNFRHSMSKLVISIDNLLPDAEIENVFLNGVYGWVYVDLAWDGWGTTGTPGTIKTGRGTTPEGQDAWVCIVPPQDITPEILITTKDGRQFTTFPQEEIHFYSGSRHKAHIVLDENLVSTEFSKEVTDWVDDSDFQFGWGPYEGWSVIGSIYDSNWDSDFTMYVDGHSSFDTGVMHDCCYTRIEYYVGQEFKFRRYSSWDTNLGLPEDMYSLSGGEVVTLVPGGNNIRLSKSGRWSLWLDPISGLFQACLEDEYIESAISIDGDFSDWDLLDPADVYVAYCDENAPLTALKMMKAYADESALFIYFEYDWNQLDMELTPFHVLINSDNYAGTGLARWYSPAGIDYLVEGTFIEYESLTNYRAYLYRYTGVNGENDWNWEDWADRTETLGAGNKYAYELKVNRRYIGWSDFFSVGIDIDVDWLSVGTLPNTAATEDNPNGWGQMLQVATAGMQPYPDVIYANSIEEVLNGQDGQIYSVGGTMTSMANENYGNFYMEDGSGQLYIYGTKNADGLYPKQAGGWYTDEFGLVLGDYVVVQGVRKTYKGMVELVDVQLTKVDRVPIGLPWDTFTFKSTEDSYGIVCRTNDTSISTEIQADWISLSSIETISDQWYILIFQLEENPEPQERTAVIGLNNGNGYAELYISQEAGELDTVITIDGNMSDWDGIEGVTEGIHTLKATSDQDYLYFYSFRAAEGRYDQIWGDKTGYIYIGMDLDGDETTGVELWGNGPYEFVGVLYPYSGSANEPSFVNYPGDACMPEAYTLGNVFCMGTVTEAGAAVEYRIPRSDLPAIPDSPITIKSWGNKDLSKVTLNCTL